jgi:hypothetical protein
MTRAPVSGLAALALIATGCSAEVDVVELPPLWANPSYGAIDGIPFRVLERYELAVWQRQPGGGFRRVHQEQRSAPDQDRLFVLRYTGMPLSSATAQIQMRADGTLALVKLTDVDTQVPEALSEVATQLTAIDTARATRETAEETEAAVGRSAKQEYYEALKLALDQADVVAALPPDDATRPAAERELKLRQITANFKAAAAGVDPPFPGASL